MPRVPREEAVRTERHSAQAYTVSIKNSAEGPRIRALAEFFHLPRARHDHEYEVREGGIHYVQNRRDKKCGSGTRIHGIIIDVATAGRS